MVEVFVPFLLILMKWDPERGTETMDVRVRLHISQEECEAAGQEIDALRSEWRVEPGWFAWRCVKAPTQIENRSSSLTE
ncbi:MAG: hypothetical protein AAGH53_08675 [Pseudomonadota bacterium]